MLDFQTDRQAPLESGPVHGATSRSGALRWDRVLIWFMRALAILWIVKGLMGWALILGVGRPTPLFEERTLGFQTTTIYFAVIDLVAAIGVWLASTWGGVMWLLAIMSYLILAVFFPAIVPSNILTITLSIALIGAYLTISWLAANEQ